jgi:hypothetical protein
MARLPCFGLIDYVTSHCLAVGHRHKRIHRLLIGMAHLSCFG